MTNADEPLLGPCDNNRIKREGIVSKSRGHKVKGLAKDHADTEVFWMSLDEAKQAIAEKYEFLAERYERRYPKAAKQ